jgi:choline kinase
MKKAAILAAGEGLRLREIARYKPIVKIYGLPLFEITFKNLHFNRFNQVTVIFNEDEKEMNLSLLPSLTSDNVNYFFKNTPSSMHSLLEVFNKLNLSFGEHMYVSMVDSIIKPVDAKMFINFCQTLTDNESAIVATSYIEDEKPLTLKVSQEGFVSEFQCSKEESTLITSGIYYFSGAVRPLLIEMINNGHTKMRNFLTELVVRNHKIKVFCVEKTLDIDRPLDTKEAETFLRESIF